MLKLFKNTFRTTSEGIILAVPFIFFMWVVTFYISYSWSVVDTIPKFVLAGVTLLFMFSAFGAGWFYMVKKCVEFSKKDFILDKDKESESLKLIQAFPVGIGKYFLKFVCVLLIFVVLVYLVSRFIYLISVPFVDNIHFTLSQMNMEMTSSQDIQAFINSLPQDQLVALFNLHLILMVTSAIFSFLFMLWIPEVIYTKRNPLTALFTSMYKVFIKFVKSIKLFIYMAFMQFVVSALSSIALVNPFTYMIMMIVFFYFVVYIVVLLFSYYDEEFNEPKAEDNCDHGTDC